MTHGSLSQCEAEHCASGCCSGSVGLAGSSSWDTGEHSDQTLHNGSKHWGCCWVHHSSLEHCWAPPGVVPDCQTVVGGAIDSDCHTAVGIRDTAGSGSAEGTSHDSTDRVAPGFSIENPAEDKHTDRCFF
jgi:hypothetical protein